MSLIPGNFTDGAFTLTDDAGHSETLTLPSGDQALADVVPDGRALEVYESQGAAIGARKGARTFPTFTVNGTLSTPSAAFHLLALGVTAGFVSTTADIGDYPANDWNFTFDYQGEVRNFTGDDAILTAFSVTKGSPSTVSMTFQLLGPMSADGTVIISSR